MTSNAVQRPQTPGALWVGAAWARLRCNAPSTMTRHRLDRRALHPDPRRSQRDPRDFHHGLLEQVVLFWLFTTTGNRTRTGNLLSATYPMIKDLQPVETPVLDENPIGHFSGDNGTG